MPAFLAPVDYPIGVSADAMKAGDFNNDTVQDLAVLNLGNSTVNVLLGNHDGTFQPARSSLAGEWPLTSSLAVGDFNEDGELDVATGSNYYNLYWSGGDDVIVLLGHGDGTFGPPAYLGTNLAAESVTAGDLNGDDHLDLVVTSRDDYQQQSVSVFLGRGDGTFAAATTYGPDTNYLPSPALADVNGDGNTDLVGGRSVFLGNGDGTLREPSDIGVSAYYSTTIGDFDADGKLDIAGTNFDRVGVLRGNGDGTFQSPQSLAAGLHPHSVSAADMNGDSVLDLVVQNDPADGVDGGLTILLGDGEGSFGPPITTTVAGYHASLVLADFNADGLPDAAETNYVPGESGSVSVLRNDGTWPPDDPPSVSIRDLTMTEGNTGTAGAAFTVILSLTTDIDVAVHFATADITATAGSDYTAASGTVIIPAGQIYAMVEIAVRGDRLGEPTETFAVNLSSPTHATIADGQGVGRIVDDEPRISIGDVSRTEGRQGRTTLFTFTITLSAAYDQPVTMSFGTVNGTATTGNGDYVAKSGTLTFAPGETTKTITIEVKGDNKRETNETFFLDLSGNSSNSVLDKKRGIGTILNDD